MPKGLLRPCLKKSNSMGGDISAGQAGMPPQSVARLACRHSLGAGGAFGAARSQVQDGLTPMADSLLHEVVDGINLHALRTPAEGAVGGWITTADDVDPEGFLVDRLQQIRFNVQALLLGELAHPVERAFNHLGNGRNLDARVRAQNRHRFFSAVRRGWTK